MSNNQVLDKTVWTFKHFNDEELVNESVEIILNCLDKIKFEINLNKYYSAFSVDVDKYLSYSNEENDKKEQMTNANLFESKYHHAVITGTYSLDQDNQIIIFNIEKIFTNEENKYDSSSSELMKGELNKTQLIFSKDNLINKSLEIEDALILKFHGQYKK